MLVIRDPSVVLLRSRHAHDAIPQKPTRRPNHCCCSMDVFVIISEVRQNRHIAPQRNGQPR